MSENMICYAKINKLNNEIIKINNLLKFVVKFNFFCTTKHIFNSKIF